MTLSVSVSLPLPIIRLNRIAFHYSVNSVAARPGAPPTRKLGKLAGQPRPAGQFDTPIRHQSDRTLLHGNVIWFLSLRIRDAYPARKRQYATEVWKRLQKRMNGNVTLETRHKSIETNIWDVPRLFSIPHPHPDPNHYSYTPRTWRLQMTIKNSRCCWRNVIWSLVANWK